MRKTLYTEILKPEERLHIIKSGAVLKCASVNKEADGILNTIADAGTKGIVVGSLITGIPLGIMAHMVAQKVKKKRKKEDEVDKQIDFYRNGAEEIERGLAAQGAVY